MNGKENTPPIQEEKKRCFLRIPVTISAKMVLENRTVKHVQLKDLSSGGLSFLFRGSESVSDTIDVDFKLERRAKPIHTQLKVHNRRKTFGGLRIGCQFINLTKDAKRDIERYITNFVNLNTQRLILNFAAFLLTIDALLRLGVYVGFRYYENTSWGQTTSVAPHLAWYGFVLIGYLFCSLSSFFITERSNDIRKNNFLNGMWFLTPSYTFLVIKASWYLDGAIWHDAPLWVSALCMYTALLIIYTGFALCGGALSFQKVKTVISSLDTHLYGIVQRKTSTEESHAPKALKRKTIHMNNPDEETFLPGSAQE